MSAIISQGILIEIAKGEHPAFKMAQDMIGLGELALLIAQAAVSGTTVPLSPTKVSKVLDMTVAGARKKIENCAVRERINASGAQTPPSLSPTPQSCPSVGR
jgi:hypothetical protein